MSFFYFDSSKREIGILTYWLRQSGNYFLGYSSICKIAGPTLSANATGLPYNIKFLIGENRKKKILCCFDAVNKQRSDCWNHFWTVTPTNVVQNYNENEHCHRIISLQTVYSFLNDLVFPVAGSSWYAGFTRSFWSYSLSTHITIFW